MAKNQGKYAVEKKDPLAPFYPIIGITILVIAAAVGWFSAPFILELTTDFIPAESLNSLVEIDPNMPIYLIAGSIFLVIVMLFSAIYAMFAPKQDKRLAEGVLMKERQEMEAERKRTKARKRKMRERMKAATKTIDDI